MLILRASINEGCNGQEERNGPVMLGLMSLSYEPSGDYSKTRLANAAFVNSA